jgi:hypothetical protein
MKMTVAPTYVRASPQVSVNCPVQEYTRLWMYIVKLSNWIPPNWSLPNHPEEDLAKFGWSSRVDQPITDCLPMTKHLFISSSYVLHYE